MRRGRRSARPRLRARIWFEVRVYLVALPIALGGILAVNVLLTQLGWRSTPALYAGVVAYALLWLPAARLVLAREVQRTGTLP